MDAQEIFDTVAEHLFTQGKQAVSDKGCAYRGRDNTTCAVGCLIKDSEYLPAMDDGRALAKIRGFSAEHLSGTGVASLIDAGVLPARLVPHRVLLSFLQNVHDGCLMTADDKFNRADLVDRLFHAARFFDLNSEVVIKHHQTVAG